MARLNTHASATPQRRTSADSLYRNPTSHADARASTARDSSYSVMSPARSPTSDKENHHPTLPGNTSRPPTKGPENRHMAVPRLPTPSSGSSSTGRSSKRRRTDGYNLTDSTRSSVDNDTDVDAQETDADEGADAQDAVDEDAPDADGNEEEDESTKYYDPQQNPDIRREVRNFIRNNHRALENHRDEYVKPDSDGIHHFLVNADRSMRKVKQTSDAAMDARALVFASELAGKRLDNSLYGNADVGLDVDQFVSKCIFFMRSGGNTAEEERAGSSTQARNRRQTQAVTQEDGEDDDDVGDGLDWALLGREACFPCNKRPAVSGFLLGPLSVQKRARAVQSRRGKSQRQPAGPATRPQELTQADLQQSENSNLTHIVKGISRRLEDHITTASQTIENELDDSDDDMEAVCKQHRLYLTPDKEPSVSLFDFVVNPKSFGQTVENMFYVSFLIKEGNLKVLHAEDGLPLLVPCAPRTIDEQRERNVQKHQAIFSLDYPTWQSLIDAFDIKEPLIPHRVEEESTVSAGGWYG